LLDLNVAKIPIRGNSDGDLILRGLFRLVKTEEYFQSAINTREAHESQ